MPRGAFERLDPEKRRGILRAAAEEFARHGFHGASLNRIIEQAALSKGAMYYYFEDKADLFNAVFLDRFGAQLDQMVSLPEVLTPGEFWQLLDALSEQNLRLLREDPIVVGLYRALLELVRSGEMEGALKPLIERSMDVTRALVARGQAIGAVRRDLPVDLIVEILRGIDDAMSRWHARHFETIEHDQYARIGRALMQMMKATLSPAPLAPPSPTENL